MRQAWSYANQTQTTHSAMTNKVEIKVTRELLANSPVNDEYIFRQLASKMVNDMPLEELKKLITFTITDPTTREARAKMNDVKTPEHERIRLMMLLHHNLILYEAEIFLL